MTKQFVFYSKLIILKDLSKYGENREAKNILIPFEEDHNQNDKTYKLIQYKNISKNVHQLIFINLHLQTILECLNLNESSKPLFKFTFTLNEILTSKEIHIKDLYTPNNLYLYKIRNFIALNNNKNNLINSLNSNILNEEIETFIEEKLLSHIKRLIFKIGIQEKINLTIDVFPESYEIPQQADLKKYPPYMFTFLFQTNAFIPEDFNLGRHIAIGRGCLNLINVEKYDNEK